MIFEPVVNDPDVSLWSAKAAPVIVVPSELIWRPYTVTSAAVSPLLAMKKPSLPTVIPPMSLAVPLFWTKKVSVTKALISPAPTNPSGLELPLLAASAASRPEKLGLSSSWRRIAPLVIQVFGASSVMLPAKPPAALVMRTLPLSVFSSIASLALSVRLSDVPALMN